MVSSMKLYTKTGDKGLTGLFGGDRVSKTHSRIECYGTVDELNSVLGVARAHTSHRELIEIFQIIQNQLFNLGADLSTPIGTKFEHKVKRITLDSIHFLEEKIDFMQAITPEMKNFILPGGSVCAANLHVARTVCRRAERLCIKLSLEENISENPQIYLNRLSDFFFICARYANVLDGLEDIEWTSK
jgi:cob(I)alamin adenosyltransferase